MHGLGAAFLGGESFLDFCSEIKRAKSECRFCMSCMYEVEKCMDVRMVFGATWTMDSIVTTKFGFQHGGAESDLLEYRANHSLSYQELCSRY